MESSLVSLKVLALLFLGAPAMLLAQGRWIVPSQVAPSDTPCPILRRAFTLDGMPASGTVRIIGLGHFHLTLNRKQVGRSLIDEAWSQYNKTLYFQEFDITNLLRSGENVFGVLLGNSFWCVGPANDSARYVKTDAMPDFSGGHPFLLWMEAHIRMENGREVAVVSDSSWRWHDGPLTFSHIYAGEDYDARRLQKGWDAPGFDAESWSKVRIVQAPAGKMERFTAPPIEAFEHFSPLEILHPRAGELTYVYAQNCSALLRYTIQGAPGQTVRFKPCEFADSTGEVRFTYTWGTGKEIWQDYTIGGRGEESHQTLFCYDGCQYVGVTGAVPLGAPNPEGLPVLRSLELVHVRAACPIVGEFVCSSPLENGAFRMIDWSIRSNMSYIATDCPHREKNGWQEQNWHMARAISYRFNTESWFRKITRDIRDAQLPDGHIPTNCPNYLVGIGPHGYWNEAPEWGISGVLLPWHLYQWYGDRETLSESFESMCRYVDYLSAQAKDGIITSNLGDWYDYGHGKGDGPSRWTPNEVSATAIWALGAKTVSEAARVLMKNGEAERYQRLFETIRSSFQRHFFDPVTKTVRNNGSCQAAHAAALEIGLVPEGDREEVLAGILDDLKKRDYQQTVGEVMQVFFVRALAEGARNDILHRVYSREKRGSYGFMVHQGFTTLPESWDAKPGTANSMNHFMLGHLMEWQFAYLAGIRQEPGSVGWRKVLIGPNPGNLDSLETSFESPGGRITVHWRQSGGRFSLNVRIPEGVQAEALLPDGERKPLRPGLNVLHSGVGDFPTGE